MSTNNNSSEQNLHPQHTHDDQSKTSQLQNSQQDDQNSSSKENESSSGSQTQIIDGNVYQNFMLTKDISKVLPIVRDLNLRHDDVIMAGFPKTGNHWIFEILHMILKQDATFTDTLMSDCFIEGNGEDVQRILDEFPAPRVLTSHLRCNRFPEQIIEKKVKIVYPLRNLKDVTVSMYSMVTAFTNDHRCTTTFNEFFEEFMSGKFAWGDWFAHVWAMEKFMKEHPDHPVFVVSYERMKAFPTDVIRELCAFLGKPDAVAEEIARVTEMSNMKPAMVNGKEGEFLKDKLDVNSLFRKGIIGDWKQRLTVSQSETVDELFKQKMADSDLARLVKDYM